MPASIDPNAYYTLKEVKAMLGVTSRRLGAAQTSGELVASRRGRNTFFRGQWLIDWIDPQDTATAETTPPKTRNQQRGAK